MILKNALYAVMAFAGLFVVWMIMKHNSGSADTGAGGFFGDSDAGGDGGDGGGD